MKSKSEFMLRLIFYPGVIVHELSHLIICLFLGVKVKKLSFGITESYVKHDQTDPIRMSLIALAPFYLGFIWGGLAFHLAKLMYFSQLIWFVVLNYLGICILYYSIPSSQDTKNIFNTIKNKIRKKWKKNKIQVIFLCFFVYLPIFLIGFFVNLFDHSEIFKVGYVLLIFAFIYGFL